MRRRASVRAACGVVLIVGADGLASHERRQGAQETTRKSVGRGWPVTIPYARFTAIRRDFVGRHALVLRGTSDLGYGGSTAGVTPLAREFSRRRTLKSTATLDGQPVLPLQTANRAHSLGRLLERTGRDREQQTRAKEPGAIAMRDYPREAIGSPYTFKTAQEQYDAFSPRQSAGGPTVHTKGPGPEERSHNQESTCCGRWSTRWCRAPLCPELAEPQWIVGCETDPGVLTLLKPSTEAVRAADVQQGQQQRRQLSSRTCRRKDFLSGGGGPVVRASSCDGRDRGV